MELPDGEPECGPWRDTSPAELLGMIRALPTPLVGPWIVGIDGRGGSGKTVLAGAIAAAAEPLDVAVDIVHTDDVAWHQSFFGWDGLLAEHVLEPVRAGAGARYRPPAWSERGRPGEVAVSARAALVLVEGSGVIRRTLTPLLDATVWVQVDVRVATARLRERDGDTAATRAFIAEWAREEEPFMLAEQPWARCTRVVSSTADGHLRLGRRTSADQ